MNQRDYLSEILERTRREVARRYRHGAVTQGSVRDESGCERALNALRRPSRGKLRVIAEVKFRSPSAGQIVPWSAGLGRKVASRYVEGGASAVSVLADRKGFGGSPLEVRRVANTVNVPVLFKGFVIDAIQVDLARAANASMVLLLVRALEQSKLVELVDRTLARGMEPVVEAASIEEVQRALETRAHIIGVNARDLSTFRVDRIAAEEAISAIPPDKVAVLMSGVRDVEDIRRIEATRADAALVGETLMRSTDAAALLQSWLGN